MRPYFSLREEGYEYGYLLLIIAVEYDNHMIIDCDIWIYIVDY